MLTDAIYGGVNAAVLTAMAPGRFCAAIHQAPMRRHGLTLPGDWLKNRLLFKKSLKVNNWTFRISNPKSKNARQT